MGAVNLVAMFSLLILSVSFVSAVPWNSKALDKTDEDFDVFRDLNNVDLDFSSQNQRRLQRRDTMWCAQWSEYCVPGSKLDYAKCCSGLRCTCGSALFGTENKCQCKRESIFG